MTDGTGRAVSSGRIAILLQSLDGGGAQRRMVTLANRFVRLGRRVDVVVVSGGGELADELSPAIRLYTLGGQRERLNRPNTIEDLAAYLHVERPVVLLSGAAVVHPLAVAARAAFPAIALVLRASSHPLRPIRWTRPWHGLKELIERRGRARCYARADAIVAVSEDVAAAMRRLAPGVAVKVIRNPIITPRFRAGATQPITLPWDQDLDGPLIVSIGRIHRAKDFPTLLRAFALFRQSRPGRLVIIGDSGSSRGRRAVLRLINRLDIAEDVAVLGPTNAIAAWLARADLFVSSSIWEGSPAVLVEAMAMGCTVVATDCPGGSHEILQGGRIGRLVPMRDPVAMARAMAVGLDYPTSPETLIAASNLYAESGRAEEYLAMIDSCIKTAVVRRSKGVWISGVSGARC